MGAIESIQQLDIVDLVRQGLTISEIADKYGRTYSEVAAVLGELMEVVRERKQELATEVFCASHVRLNDLYSTLRAVSVDTMFDVRDRVRAAIGAAQVQKQLTDLHQVGRAANVNAQTFNFGTMTDSEIETFLHRQMTSHGLHKSPT